MTPDVERRERKKVFGMQNIELTDEDAAHIRQLQAMSIEEKEAIIKIAKFFGKDEKRESLYTLIKAQSEISGILAVHGHFNWAGRMFLKAGAIAGVFIAVASAWKIWFGK